MEARTLAGGRYELIEEIGRGGMATVWRGRDTRLGVERAIKILDPPPRRKAVPTRDRFDRESKIMARLEHPNVVPVYDAGQDGDQMWLVLSLVDGGSVADRLKARGALPVDEAVAIVRAVLEALVAAHDRGIVHRDVKPQNVLLDRMGVPRLTDFGIARLLDDDSGPTRTGAVLGTWTYMAPEQRTDSKRVDPRTDLYAVGVLLVAMLIGHDPTELLDPDAFEGVLATVPANLRPFVSRCLRHKAEDRYLDAREALVALASAVEERPSARLPWGWVAAVGAGIAVAGATTVGMLALGVGVGVWAGLDAPAGEAPVPPAETPADADPPSEGAPDPDPVAPDPVPVALDPAPDAAPDAAPAVRPSPVRPRPAPVPAPVSAPVPAPAPAPTVDTPAPVQGVPARLIVSSRPIAFRIDDGPSGTTPWTGQLAPGPHVVVLLDGAGQVVHRRTWNAVDQPTLCIEPDTWQPCRR